MDDYGNRGVFRGVSSRRLRPGAVAYTMTWHRDRVFQLVVDAKARAFTIPIVLPGVPARSSMYREFRAFVASHADPSLPPHRRIDPAKARVVCGNKGGNVSLTMTIADGDYGYGAQRLVHLVHEVFVMFLAAGIYYDYRVAQLGADPDEG